MAKRAKIFSFLEQFNLMFDKMINSLGIGNKFCMENIQGGIPRIELGIQMPFYWWDNYIYLLNNNYALSTNFIKPLFCQWSWYNMQQNINLQLLQKLWARVTLLWLYGKRLDKLDNSHCKFRIYYFNTIQLSM